MAAEQDESPSQPARRQRLDQLRAAAARTGQAARRADHDPRLQTAVRRLRAVLPGDAHFGDPLSLGGAKHAEVAGRTVVGLTGNRPGVVREVGLGGLQIWQAMLERFGKGSGEHEVTLAFLDLANFSSWALSAGDEQVLSLLRRVSDAWEPPIEAAGGTVVKRLGDGLMAAFADPQKAVEAVLEGRDQLSAVHGDGFEPRLRAGLHLGRPRRVGGDYLGVSVNVAARIGERAKADEILVSGEVLERIDPTDLTGAAQALPLTAEGCPQRSHPLPSGPLDIPPVSTVQTQVPLDPTRRWSRRRSGPRRDRGRRGGGRRAQSRSTALLERMSGRRHGARFAACGRPSVGCAEARWMVTSFSRCPATGPS